MVGILSYIAICLKGDSTSPLRVHADGSPLTREQFVRMVKRTLHIANTDQLGHLVQSFRIGAASPVAATGVPAYLIKMLGC